MARADGVLLLIVFKLKEGVTREEWLAAVESAVRWSEGEPGYVSTELFHAPDTDTWIDIDIWASKEDAGLHMQKAPAAPENAAMFGLIDPETVQVTVAEPTDRAFGDAKAGSAPKALELIFFRLKPGVTPEQWQSALAPALEWATEQPGFISSEMFYVEDSKTHVDVNFLASAEESAAHLEQVVKTDENAPMFELIDDASVEMHVATQVPIG